MGMLDKALVLAEAQAVTATGDTASTNVYDSGNAANGDAGQTGENLWAQVICTTTATSGGSATIAGVLQSSPDNSTWTDAAAGPATAVASVTAGTVLLQVQPPPGMQRYWRTVIRVGTAVLTAGAFDSYISNTIQRSINRASGFAVS
jgi:hypothetical protein